MSEHDSSLTPLQLLERDFPGVIRQAIVASPERCYCGSCHTTLNEYDVSELDRCRELGCGTAWTHVIRGAALGELPPYSFRLAVRTARDVWDEKRLARASISAPRYQKIGRQTTNLVVNPEYL